MVDERSQGEGEELMSGDYRHAWNPNTEIRMMGSGARHLEHREGTEDVGPKRGRGCFECRGHGEIPVKIRTVWNDETDRYERQVAWETCPVCTEGPLPGMETY